MKFYKPQLGLSYEVKQNENGEFQREYNLHAVTLCRRTNFRSDGFEINNEIENDVCSILLKLTQDPNLPDLEYVTPVVHTIKLGYIDFEHREGIIEASVIASALEAEDIKLRSKKEVKRKTKVGGKSSVSTTDADDKSRPGNDQFLY